MLAAEHLTIWDQVGAAQPSARGVVLAFGFGGTSSLQNADAWSVGERDAYLLAVHRAAFGERLDLLANCPSCAEPAAFEINVDALLEQRIATDWPLHVSFQNLILKCRRPAAADLSAAWSGTELLEVARRRLFYASVEAYGPDGARHDLTFLDDAAIDAASKALENADPLADIRFTLTCPTCATRWEALFDPPHILWRALDAWARSELDDVRRLANSYGWSEPDILAMHPIRRRFYLDSVP